MAFVGHRATTIQTILAAAVAILFLKVLFSILFEYRWYFPPDFDNAAFLIGRRDSFVGVYSSAFYVHIISGPIAVALGAFQVVSGRFSLVRGLHRKLGGIQTVLVIMVAASGLVMARDAFSGLFAAWGFALLSILTAFSVTLTAYSAANGSWQTHRLWASRCLVLLCSPLLLRLVAGLTIVTRIESVWSYRLNAWLSWMVPLIVHELWWRRSESNVDTESKMMVAKGNVQ